MPRGISLAAKSAGSVGPKSSLRTRPRETLGAKPRACRDRAYCVALTEKALARPDRRRRGLPRPDGVQGAPKRRRRKSHGWVQAKVGWSTGHRPGRGLSKSGAHRGKRVAKSRNRLRGWGANWNWHDGHTGPLRPEALVGPRLPNANCGTRGASRGPRSERAGPNRAFPRTLEPIFERARGSPGQGSICRTA
jgi:hypothetical protein